MTAGQLLFKMAANSYAIADGGTGARLWGLFYNLYFLSALVLYAGFALLWVWMLAFALTPLHAVSLLGETISLRLIIGLLLNTRRSVFRIGLMEL
jgi:hypothetical protein